MSYIITGVRPIICQPPGESDGYVPVCSPAIPTEPAGIKVLGEDNRGVAMRGSMPPK